jgi:RecA/RadA recombinase
VTYDEEKQALEIELMETKIDHHRLDMKKLEQDLRMENRKFMLQIVVALVAALGVGVALGRLWLFHT